MSELVQRVEFVTDGSWANSSVRIDGATLACKSVEVKVVEGSSCLVITIEDFAVTPLAAHAPVAIEDGAIVASIRNIERRTGKRLLAH